MKEHQVGKIKRSGLPFGVKREPRLNSRHPSRELPFRISAREFRRKGIIQPDIIAAIPDALLKRDAPKINQVPGDKKKNGKHIVIAKKFFERNNG